MDAGDVLLILVGVVVAALVSVIAEAVRGHNAAALDGAKRKDDRRLGRAEYDRGALLELRESARLLRMYAVNVGARPMIGEGLVRLRHASTAIGDEQLRTDAAKLAAAAETISQAPATDDPIHDPTRGAYVPEVERHHDALQERAGRLILDTWADPPAIRRRSAPIRYGTAFWHWLAGDPPA